MITFKRILIALALAASFMAGCSKDNKDETAPEISGLEIGEGNNKTFYQGGDFHLEFEALDNEGLDYYTVNIFPETKSGSVAWEYFNRWDFEPGIKNDLVHQHEIIIPPDGNPGSYHFDLAVVDINGNSSVEHETITLLETVAGNGPEIQVINHPFSGETFEEGDTIAVAGHIHSDGSNISGIFIALVKTSDSLSNEDVSPGNAIVMFHNHDLETDDTDFNAAILAGSPEDNNYPTPDPINSWSLGNAYILVKAVDGTGHISFSEHFAIFVNGTKNE